MSDSMIANLLVIATLLPFAGFAFVILFGTRFKNPDHPAWLTVGVMGVSFLCSVVALVGFMGRPIGADGARQAICVAYDWLAMGHTSTGAIRYIQVGPYVDAVTVVLMSMVTLISMLVHVYSIGYMEGDKRKTRFMAYMQFFTFTMLGIVVANSLLQLFVFWELVGISSYLLIGFWYEKRGPQLACKKAFVMNRIGDAGFLVGIGIIFLKFGGDVILRSATPGQGVFGTMMQAGLDPLHAGVDDWWLTIAGIGLFCGAIGKSAQFPLHTWLPDAMEGPTPVSSIVHSATMVAAGVYLTARILPILTPAAHLFVTTIGLITLVMAALIAVTQSDIKKVLAYSTLSQLGYMIAGLGAGAYTFALFHLITHAFFKCCLFQCSGSVIIACHHEQEMPKYGGLAKKMPWTTLAFALSTLAIAGASIPMTAVAFSGFYSKDGIIAGTVNYGQALQLAGMSWGWIFYWGPVAIAYVTAFYMMRAFTLTFLGKPRDKHIYEHAHEMKWTMWVPQMVLATGALAIGWPFFRMGLTIQRTAPQVAQVFDENLMEHAFHEVHGFLLHGFAWIIPIALAYLIYRPGYVIADKIAAIPGIKQIHWWLYNKMGFDGLFDIVVVSIVKIVSNFIGLVDRGVVDGIVNLFGYLTKQLAFGIGFFDWELVDGAVRGTGRSVVRLGRRFHLAQSGNLRGYVMYLILSIMLGLIITIPLAMGWVNIQAIVGSS